MSALRISSAQQHGFTLLELLVVIVIVGLMTTLAVTSFSGGNADDVIDDESRRLSILIGLAQEESILQSQEMGLLFTTQAYQFVHLAEGKWLPIQGDNNLKQYSLPTSTSLQLWLEGNEVVLADDFAFVKNAAEDIKPHIMLLSSGEMSAFKLQLTHRDAAVHYQLNGTINGEVKTLSIVKDDFE